MSVNSSGYSCYTAIISDWVYDRKQNIIIGTIFYDVHGRFDEGAKIKTSRLLPMSMQASTPKPGAIINTTNNTYLLGKRR
ncbi:hypothetical protein NVP1082O_32 [Vibrio phage 1.082.O._10N.261.49.E4]|nr:hypothetical protein NVP1082O_32 [Vibrio phage 1.082.O._10N.261.49.E4]